MLPERVGQQLEIAIGPLRPPAGGHVTWTPSRCGDFAFTTPSPIGMLSHHPRQRSKRWTFSIPPVIGADSTTNGPNSLNSLPISALWLARPHFGK